MIIVNDFNGWPALLSLPPEQRHAPAPPQLLHHLEQVNGYPARAVSPEPDLKADLVQAMAELPGIVRERLQEHFLGVYFVSGAGSSAATDIVVGPDGEFHGIAIVLDVDAIGQRSANEWISWRENMPFTVSAMRVSVRIADGAEDNRKNALQILLLHEVGHVLSAGRNLVPDWWLQPEDIGPTNGYAFLPLSWESAGPGKIRPRPGNSFTGRAQLRYYGTPQLGPDDIMPMYRALLETNFFTMYGAQSADEDFAESFALYVHTVLMQKPYVVRIHHGQRLLMQYACQWEEPRFAAKLAVLEQLLPDLFTQLRQPYAPLCGVAALMRRAFRHEDMTPITAALLERAQNYPQDAHAYLDCSTALQLIGERDLAMQVQAEAISLQQHYQLPFGGAKPALRLLALMGPGDLMANTPIEFLLEQGDVALELLYLSDAQPWPPAFPQHDVLMVAIAESDINQPLLRRLAERLADWPHPVLNRPEHIAVLSRDGAWQALAGTPGVLMPQTRRSTRAEMARLALLPESLPAMLPGASFPLIVRPLGSHAGHDLEKIGSGDELVAYLERVPAQQFYMAGFVDYSSGDGLFRKLRIVLMVGRAYICHQAISSHWMVHYLNAGMDDSAEKRAEEAACMQQFDTGFALRHGATLAEIQRRLQLPYLGIDCAETRDGRLLVFEVDNAMIVHAMDDQQRYPYKQPAMRKVFDAFRSLLASAAVFVEGGQ